MKQFSPSDIAYLPDEFYDHMGDLTHAEIIVYLALCRFTAAKKKPTWSSSLLDDYAASTHLSKEVILKAKAGLIRRGLLPKEATGLPYVI